MTILAQCEYRFQQYNHDICAGTIQTVYMYIYPLNKLSHPLQGLCCNLRDPVTPDNTAPPWLIQQLQAATEDGSPLLQDSCSGIGRQTIVMAFIRYPVGQLLKYRTNP